ncbi:MAG: outer membrane protein assembly factor BamD [Flammeovirgaceae bacterium]|jgi:outer membrane protein assembly factor BamD
MRNTFFAIIFFAILSGGCSNLQQTLKQTDVNDRYNSAVAFYEEEEYAKAGIVFEDLIPDIIGKPQAEKVQYYYAYCHFYQKQYDLSSYYFKTFHDNYQRSAFAKEALYMSAKSQAIATPQYNLDQSGTEQTINALQDFINRYSESEYVAEAEKTILDLRAKLEEKSFEIAELYQRLRKYKAATIAYDNFRKNFPDSKMKEEAIFRQLESQYELARLSYLSYKLERYQETSKLYFYFIDKYPSSAFKKKAENYYENVQKELAGL